MLFRNNLSSLVFLSGLSVTAAASLWFDGLPISAAQPQTYSALAPELTLRAPQQLSAQDLSAARTAWAYFQANTQPDTGLVDAVAGFASGTLWDQGSYLLALVSALRLGIISQEIFDHRVTQFLDTVERLPLYQGHLPNKVYNTRSLEMVNYDNTAAPEGIGWSALDVARMLSAFRVLEHHHPAYAPKIRAVVAQWNLALMTSQGRLIGADHQQDEMVLLQEGRLGYEQYGARAAALWGLDALQAATAGPILDWREVSAATVPIDRRRASAYKAITAIVSEPFLLQAFEMGLTEEGRILAERVYQAQENRFKHTGIPTMVSEGHIDQEPHFLYASVFGNGQDWAVIAEDGSHHPELRNLSLKAVFGWNALYQTDYTSFLRQEVAPLAQDKGWASGRYEADDRPNMVHTANTNAVVLQALHFSVYGPLLQAR